MCLTQRSYMSGNNQHVCRIERKLAQSLELEKPEGSAGQKSDLGQIPVEALRHHGVSQSEVQGIQACIPFISFLVIY